VTFSLEIDARGDGRWREWKAVPVAADGYRSLLLPRDLAGEWLRVKVDRDSVATAFVHAQTPRDRGDGGALFASLAGESPARTAGLLRPAGFSRDLQFLARPLDANGRPGPAVYYEIDERLQFTRVDAPDKVADLTRVAEPTSDYVVDEASVVVTDVDNRRWRLPKRVPSVETAGTRGLREVVSERYLAHFDGTFYEVPRRRDQMRPDFSRMKPVASHDRRISDFCTWRGLLVLAGTNADAVPDGHFFRAADSRAGLWFGAIDDLYKLGAPAGEGGPWKNTAVKADEPSDPYLMTNFGRKSVTLSHDQPASVRFTIQVDILADGSWFTYGTIEVPAGQSIDHQFPDGFSAHWVRVTADRAAKATAWFRYEPSPVHPR
jgi:hypothetical protein